MTGQVSGSASALDSKMIVSTSPEVGIRMTSFSPHASVKSLVFHPFQRDGRHNSGLHPSK